MFGRLRSFTIFIPRLGRLGRVWGRTLIAIWTRFIETWQLFNHTTVASLSHHIEQVVLSVSVCRVMQFFISLDMIRVYVTIILRIDQLLRSSLGFQFQNRTK